MLVTFETAAYPRITLFGDVAIKILELMGQSGSVPGALAPADVPGAAEKLRLELERLAEPETEVAPEDQENNTPPPVSLQQRAFPILELLRAAEREQAHVTWVEGRSPP